VKANLSTPLSQRNFPVSPKPVIQMKISLKRVESINDCARYRPTPGVYSLGLNTTVFPAASAYAIDPRGVKTG
jgi:hypothetical protein